jgi:hypothetical protein
MIVQMKSKFEKAKSFFSYTAPNINIDVEEK